jgi:hypothetical protein
MSKEILTGEEEFDFSDMPMIGEDQTDEKYILVKAREYCETMEQLFDTNNTKITWEDLKLIQLEIIDCLNMDISTTSPEHDYFFKMMSEDKDKNGKL